jgi:hypothetical protein
VRVDVHRAAMMRILPRFGYASVSRRLRWRLTWHWVAQRSKHDSKVLLMEIRCRFFHATRTCYILFLLLDVTVKKNERAGTMDMKMVFFHPICGNFELRFFCQLGRSLLGVIEIRHANSNAV